MPHSPEPSSAKVADWGMCSSKASLAGQMIDYPFADHEAIAPLLRRQKPKSFEGLFLRVSKQNTVEKGKKRKKGTQLFFEKSVY